MSSYIKDNELIALIEPLLKVKNSSFVTIEKPVPDKIKDSEHSKKKFKRAHSKIEDNTEEPKGKSIKTHEYKKLKSGSEIVKKKKNTQQTVTQENFI